MGTWKESRTVRLVRKYGVSIIKDLEKCRTTPFFGLSEIGRKYNFTRERARQIYFIFYEYPYTVDLRKKRAMIDEEVNSLGNRYCASHPGALEVNNRLNKDTVNLKRKLLKALDDIGVKYTFNYRPTEVEANGKTIAVRSCMKSNATAKDTVEYWRFTGIPKYIHVVVGLTPDGKEYVIPIRQVRSNTRINGDTIYICATPGKRKYNTRSKVDWGQYVNNWDSLGGYLQD